MAKSQEEKQEQPAPEVRQGNADNEEQYDDDDDDECFPCLKCWQIIAIAVIVACVMIGVIVAIVVLFVTGGDGDVIDSIGSSGDGKVDFPPDTIFKVYVENDYTHGTLGIGTYDLTFNLKEGESSTQDATTTTDIRTTFNSEEDGVARIGVKVEINFDLDSQIDCDHTFYASTVIDSGEFGESTSDKTCTYTKGGLYAHNVRVKVDSQ